jgi:hypothetical protein
MGMERIVFVVPVVEGQARGARGGDGGQEKKNGRPVGTEGEREPSGGKQDKRKTARRAGRDGESRGRGDPQAEGGRQEQEREGAGS